MTARERFRRALVGELPDRVPVTERDVWPETLARWHREGLPDGVDPVVWLGMDKWVVEALDCSLRLPEEVQGEDDETQVARLSDGQVVRRFKHSYHPPQQLDWLIQTPDDWLRYRDRLAPSRDRVPESYLKSWRRSREEDFWLAVKPREPVWWVLVVMGFEAGLQMMLDRPDVVEEMIATQTRLTLYLLDVLMELGKPDALWYASDLCYKNGMLFSPRLYRQLVLPYHKRITAACWERGIVPMFHCDGKLDEFLPLLIEARFASLHPLEARAGNDVRDLKPLYGDRITFVGNVSVERLSGTIEEAEEEVRTKVAAAKPGGRYVYATDHSAPPTIPLANYRRAVEVAKEVGRYE